MAFSAAVPLKLVLTAAILAKFWESNHFAGKKKKKIVTFLKLELKKQSILKASGST